MIFTMASIGIGQCGHGRSASFFWGSLLDEVAASDALLIGQRGHIDALINEHLPL